MELRVDRYTLQARLLPTLISFILPLAIGIAAWLPAQSAAWNSLGAILISLGLTTLLAQLGRDLGKRKEPAIFRSWGGVPTTRMLSHRYSKLDPLTLKRYHQKLKMLLPDLAIPAPAEEQRNPSAANQVYDSCARFLRERTRDSRQFPLVFAENVNYGFRRNLWALKPVGITTAAVGIACCLLYVFLKWRLASPGLLFAISGILINTVLLVLWVFVFNPKWVRITAEAYAERLIGSLDSM